MRTSERNCGAGAAREEEEEEEEERWLLEETGTGRGLPGICAAAADVVEAASVFAITSRPNPALSSS